MTEWTPKYRYEVVANLPAWAIRWYWEQRSARDAEIDDRDQVKGIREVWSGVGEHNVPGDRADATGDEWRAIGGHGRHADRVTTDKNEGRPMTEAELEHALATVRAANVQLAYRRGHQDGYDRSQQQTSLLLVALLRTLGENRVEIPQKAIVEANRGQLVVSNGLDPLVRTVVIEVRDG